MSWLSSARRRALALLTVATVGLTALAGCASTTGPGPDTGAASSSLVPAAEGRTTYPLTLTTPWGETTLEKRPERIAAVMPAGTDSEMLAALGVTPVIANENADFPWTKAALKGTIETIYPASRDDMIPVEQVAAAKPDLIVAVGTDLSKQWDQLSTIAPVLTGETEQDLQAGWRDQLTWIGTALDLSDAAAKVATGYDEGLAAVASEHPEFKGRTATYIVYYDASTGAQYWSWAGSDVEKLFTTLGFDANPLAKDFTVRSPVSNELISKIDADVVLISDNSKGQIDTFVGQDVFKQLPAAKADHVALVTNNGNSFEFDGQTVEGNLPWALARSGPLSGVWAAQKLAPVLSTTLAR